MPLKNLGKKKNAKSSIPEAGSPEPVCFRASQSVRVCVPSLSNEDFGGLISASLFVIVIVSRWLMSSKSSSEGKIFAKALHSPDEIVFVKAVPVQAKDLESDGTYSKAPSNSPMPSNISKPDKDSNQKQSSKQAETALITSLTPRDDGPMYTIEVSNQSKKWLIFRKYSDFKSLAAGLKNERLQLKTALPSEPNLFEKLDFNWQLNQKKKLQNYLTTVTQSCCSDDSPSLQIFLQTPTQKLSSADERPFRAEETTDGRNSRTEPPEAAEGVTVTQLNVIPFSDIQILKDGKPTKLLNTGNPLQCNTNQELGNSSHVKYAVMKKQPLATSPQADKQLPVCSEQKDTQDTSPISANALEPSPVQDGSPSQDTSPISANALEPSPVQDGSPSQINNGRLAVIVSSVAGDPGTPRSSDVAYNIDVTYREESWTVQRKYNDFFAIYEILKSRSEFQKAENFQFPPGDSIFQNTRMVIKTRAREFNKLCQIMAALEPMPVLVEDFFLLNERPSTSPIGRRIEVHTPKSSEEERKKTLSVAEPPLSTPEQVPKKSYFEAVLGIVSPSDQQKPIASPILPEKEDKTPPLVQAEITAPEHMQATEKKAEPVLLVPRKSSLTEAVLGNVSPSEQPKPIASPIIAEKEERTPSLVQAEILSPERVQHAEKKDEPVLQSSAPAWPVAKINTGVVKTPVPQDSPKDATSVMENSPAEKIVQVAPPQEQVAAEPASKKCVPVDLQQQEMPQPASTELQSKVALSSLLGNSNTQAEEPVDCSPTKPASYPAPQTPPMTRKASLPIRKFSPQVSSSLNSSSPLKNETENAAVSISGVDFGLDGTGVYSIQVKAGAREWTASRNYNEFLKLVEDMTLEGRRPPTALPAEPNIFERLVTSKVEERKSQMQDFLNSMLSSTSIFESVTIGRFLGECLQVGSKVERLSKRDQKYHPVVILKSYAGEKFDVEYEDGRVESNVAWSRLRPVQASTPEKNLFDFRRHNSLPGSPGLGLFGGETVSPMATFLSMKWNMPTLDSLSEAKPQDQPSNDSLDTANAEENKSPQTQYRRNFFEIAREKDHITNARAPGAKTYADGPPLTTASPANAQRALALNDSNTNAPKAKTYENGPMQGQSIASLGIFGPPPKK